MLGAYPWLFLTELLLIGAIWFIIAELNDGFGKKEYFENSLHDKILRENTPLQ
ncbi:MAG: hypothetical protein PHH75_02965 [Candidatus Omnitrophica bacterium]|nr:hypothetical protein [Candidatus Omnitrophota bacterium]MDD5574121.1 hypothetical protein [Candidatus Omnitrophota bacterium]